MKKLLLILFVLLLSESVIAADVPKLIKNFKSFRELHDIQEIPIQGNIYDLSFVAYDKEFADEFGLVNENITQMDEHLRFMEVRMITEGTRTNCYYNVILDKSVELDFPDENYISLTNYKNIPTLPENFKAPIDNRKNIGKLRATFSDSWQLYKKFSNRTYLGNRGYKFNTSGKPFSNGSAFDVMLSNYIQDKNISYNIISTSRLCGGSNIFYHPEPAFWLRKKGVEEKTNLPQIKNYNTFEIPKTIVEKFKPILSKYIKSK